MLVTRKSPISGKENSKELNVTQKQLDRYYNGNETVQDVFPHLSPSDREFIKTGILKEEWDAVFGTEKDDEEDWEEENDDEYWDDDDYA